MGLPSTNNTSPPSTGGGSPSSPNQSRAQFERAIASSPKPAPPPPHELPGHGSPTQPPRNDLSGLGNPTPPPPPLHELPGHGSPTPPPQPYDRERAREVEQSLETNESTAAAQVAAYEHAIDIGLVDYGSPEMAELDRAAVDARSDRQDAQQRLRRHRESMIQNELDGYSPTGGSSIEATEIARLAGELGVGADEQAAVADAMAAGLTPQEADLPDYLFPPEYVAASEELAAAKEDAPGSNPEHCTIFCDNAELPEGVTQQEWREGQQAAFDRFEDAQENPDAQPTTTDITQHIITSPVFDNVSDPAEADVVGDFLSGQYYETTNGDLIDLADLGQALDFASASNAEIGGQFYSNLGATNSTLIPTNIADRVAAGQPLPEDTSADEIFADFANAFSRATHSDRGPGFSGETLVDAGPMSGPLLLSSQEIAPDVGYQAEAVAAMLIEQGDEHSPALTFTPQYINALSLAPEAWRSSIMESRDFGLLLIDEPPEAAALIHALGEENIGALVDPDRAYLERPPAEFRDPETGEVIGRLGQDGILAGNVLSLATDDAGAVDIVIDHVADFHEEGTHLQSGIALGADAMFAPHWDILIDPEFETANPDEVKPGDFLEPTDLKSTRDETLDFLSVVYDSGAGIFTDIATVRGQLDVYKEAIAQNPEDDGNLTDLSEAFGDVNGELRNRRFGAEFDRAIREDQQNAFNKKLFGWVLEGTIAAGLAAGGPLPLAATFVASQTLKEILGGPVAEAIGLSFPTDNARDRALAEIESIRSEAVNNDNVTATILADIGLITDDQRNYIVGGAIDANDVNVVVDGEETGDSVADWARIFKTMFNQELATPPDDIATS